MAAIARAKPGFAHIAKCGTDCTAGSSSAWRISMTATIRSILPAALCAALLTSHAEARIVRIDIQKAGTPTFEAASFGKTGQYEKLDGRAYGELDPRDPLNRSIVYIDKAPRNAAGMVEYSIDVSIIKPVDMSRGNGTIFYDVTNRGGRRAFDAFHVGANPGIQSGVV